jgi:cation diffusion facilitator family transporter
MTTKVKEVTSAAMLSVVSNTALVVLKVAVGVLIGSVSVISEAIHSGIDLLAAVIALFAVKQSSKPADEDHPYGHGKFENVSGTVEAVLIFFAAGWIIYEAVHKFTNPNSIEEPGWGVGLMLLSAIVNFVVSENLFRVGKKAQSIALEADAWHLRTDVYTSLGVMFGLFVIWVGAKLFPTVNLQWIDPVAAIAVALLIVKAAFELTQQAARDLFDVSLPAAEMDWIKAALSGRSEVKSFHRLKTRKSGKDRFIEFHLAVDSDVSVGVAHRITDEITAAIKKHLPCSYVIIHIEPCDKTCSKACLSGCVFDRVE